MSSDGRKADTANIPCSPQGRGIPRFGGQAGRGAKARAEGIDRQLNGGATNHALMAEHLVANATYHGEQLATIAQKSGVRGKCTAAGIVVGLTE